MNKQLRRLKKALLADRKKLAVMVGLCAVGLLLWGRILTQRVPRTAVADDHLATAGSSAPSAAGAISLSSGTDRTIYVDFAASLDRDIFLLNPTGYEKIVKPDKSSGKSAPRSTDDGGSRATATDGLHLQSIILGRRPRAFINGWMLAPGQTIEGFTLREIRQRYVVMEKDGSQFVLQMRVMP